MTELDVQAEAPPAPPSPAPSRFNPEPLLIKGGSLI
jgi:hypothetical protein